MAVERDKKVDILRAIALLGIIFAHVGSPAVIMQLRSFDVPLMAMLMGTSYYLTNKGRKISYFSYIVKRIKRLLLPTWKFLTIFFIVFFIISLIKSEAFYFGIDKIILSYALLSGIGYVWIIQVFLAVAFLSPLILDVSKKIKSNINFFLILIVAYLFYMILILISNAFNGHIASLYEHLILYTVGYGIMAAIGIRLKQLNKKEIGILTTVFMGIYILLLFVNDFSLTSVAKYPPTLYYLSYAIFASFALYLLLDLKAVLKLFDNKFVYFCSVNSFWIYLWHIVPVWLIKLFGSNMEIVNANFITRFIFVFSIACLLTIIQNRFSKQITFNKKQMFQFNR